jgi:hypothetical protein
VKALVRGFTLCLAVALILIPATLPTHGQIQWNRPKDKPMLPNPYTFNLSRDSVLDTVKLVLSDREIPLDPARSQEKPGVLFTKPVVFTKGALTSGSNLEYVAKRPGGNNLTWVRGRYSLQMEAVPIDPQKTKLTVYARIEGEYQTEIGGKWVECPSRGVKENEILEAILKQLEGGN